MMEEIGRPGRGTSVVLRPGEATGAWYDCQKPLCRLILIHPVTTGPLPESSASDPVSNLDPPAGADGRGLYRRAGLAAAAGTGALRQSVQRGAGPRRVHGHRSGG